MVDKLHKRGHHSPSVPESIEAFDLQYNNNQVKLGMYTSSLKIHPMWPWHFFTSAVVVMETLMVGKNLQFD